MIEGRLGAGKAQEVATQLPDQVDHEQHADLLSKFGMTLKSYWAAKLHPNAARHT